MKTKTIISTIFLIIGIVTLSAFTRLNKYDPWTKDQLMEPKDLAKLLNDPSAEQPYLYSIGPAELIKNAIDIGPTNNEAGINKLKNELTKVPKDATVIIYCGCCPFGDCPNIRPAFELLNTLKFTQHKLLNLPHNLKVDWIDHGYPMSH